MRPCSAETLLKELASFKGRKERGYLCGLISSASGSDLTEASLHNAAEVVRCSVLLLKNLQNGLKKKENKAQC